MKSKALLHNHSSSSEACLWVDSAAIDWRTNTLAASPPRTTPAEDAAAAAAEAAPKQEPKQAPLTSQPSSGESSFHLHAPCDVTLGKSRMNLQGRGSQGHG